MKPITRITYQCEKCGKEHREADQALRCEAQPVGVDSVKFWPVGMLIGYRHELITLAIANTVVESADTHAVYVNYWACRNTGMGDSVGTETCGGESVYNVPTNGLIFPLKNLNTPTCQRLIQWLVSQGITPTYWNGVMPAPLPVDC